MSHVRCKHLWKMGRRFQIGKIAWLIFTSWDLRVDSCSAPATAPSLELLCDTPPDRDPIAVDWFTIACAPSAIHQPCGRSFHPSVVGRGIAAVAACGGCWRGAWCGGTARQRQTNSTIGHEVYLEMPTGPCGRLQQGL